MISHRSEFRASVTKVAFIFPSAGSTASGNGASLRDEEFECTDEEVYTSPLSPCFSIDSFTGSGFPAAALFASFLPFHFAKSVLEGIWGFGIEDDDI